MSLRSIRAVARKEYYHLIRDFRSLYLALIIPLLLILLFGYALSLDVEHIPMVVVDHDRTPQSRDFIRKLDATIYFDVIANLPDTGPGSLWVGRSLLFLPSKLSAKEEVPSILIQAGVYPNVDL